MAQILVVDNDAGARQLLTDVLELEGYEVRAAEDGSTAVNALDVLRPDFVVLDAAMPGFDGYGILRRIREREGSPIPVLMLTAAVEPAAVIRAWAEGIDYYLGKPFTAHQLVDLLDSVLGTHPPAAHSLATQP